MRRKLAIGAAATAIILAFLLLFPFSTYDMARVHPSIGTLQKPYRSVTVGYYLDGGSVDLAITDRGGRQLRFFFPVEHGSGKTHEYVRLLIEETAHDVTNSTEVVLNNDTKKCLAEIIDHHGMSGPDSDLARFYVRGTPRDYLRILRRSLLNKRGNQ
jgi:hypothetical protein